MEKEYIRDLIKDYDKIKIDIKDTASDENENSWIKYEKEWPDYLIFPKEKDIKILDEYPELSEIYQVNKEYKKTCIDYYNNYVSILCYFIM